MTAILDETQQLWIWLLHTGGKWTAQEVAQRCGGDGQRVFRRLHGMHRRKLVEQFPPAEGCHRKRYAVTGTCLIPLGLCVGQVQADP